MLLWLALLLVYAVHRLLPMGEDGAATQTILAYFVQMSALFMSMDALPLLFGLLSVDLVQEGGGVALLNSCVAPLADADKLLLRLISPLVFLLLLAALLATQLAVRACINRSALQPQHRLARFYQLLLPAVPDSAARLPATVQSVSQVLHEPLLAREAQPLGADLFTSQCASGDSVRGAAVYHLQTLVRLVLFSYNAVTTVSLAVFRLRSVGPLGHRLLSYPSIDPFSPQYVPLAVLFAVVLVTLVLGGPVALLAYLVRCQRRGIIGPQAETRQQPDAQTQSVARPVLALSAPMSSIVAILLTRAYRPQYWWYPVLVLLRRLLLIAMLTFLSTGAYSYLTIVNNAFVTAHLLLWPYRHARDSALELLALIALSTQTGLLSAYPVLQERPSWINALLWLLFVIPVCGSPAAVGGFAMAAPSAQPLHRGWAGEAG